MNPSERWPALPLAKWKDTYATLHMWTQIVGKVRLALCPNVNHWWGTALYVTARGLTTSAMPYEKGIFEVHFDFIHHALEIETSLGETRTFRLVPRTVAAFYQEFMAALHSLGINARIWDMPVEVPRPVRFTLDATHASYDPEYAHRFWQVLAAVTPVFEKFRAGFLGKSSPVHFFWGSFDLAVSRFSGRRAPVRPDADTITKEGYSHEVISVGFWPGDGEIIKDAAFYAYATPEPPGFKDSAIKPAKAFYRPEKSEFFLMYDDVRLSNSPEQSLLDFCQSTYNAAANLAHWNRAELEKPRAHTGAGV
ncbi:MAG TPA: DUF5996 family protein [Candidatus Udaeobacter sp.]|nr:DUF5996 family protein [Candidatus Udaeobacter sp.]